MAEANNDKAAAPGMSLPMGIGSLVGIFGLSALWVGIGTLLHLHSFFASFVFLWYWGVTDRLALNKLAPALLGALLGVALSWQLSYFAAHLGAEGLAIGVGIIALAVFIQLMNWVPIMVNLCAMLFLAFLTAPQFAGTNYVDVALTIIASAVYVSVLVVVGTRVAAAWGGGKAVA
jgi:hypothetical protein